MTNRVNYLKFLSQNKNALVSDIAVVNKDRAGQPTSLLGLDDDGDNVDVQTKMN